MSAHRRLKGPLEPERLRRTGQLHTSSADGFTPPEMFLARATATVLVEGPSINPDRTFDGLEKERANWPFSYPGSAARCRPDPYCLPHRHRSQAAESRHSETPL